MKPRTIILLFIVLSLSGLLQLGNANMVGQSTDSPPITRVIENFWNALGAFDAEKMKQTLDWPVSIVEASPRETKNAHVLATPLEFDEEFSKHRPASGKSDFYGTRLSNYKVEMLTSSLAVVTYNAVLPANIAAAREGDFKAVAILRKASSEDVWKIVFITVPK